MYIKLRNATETSNTATDTIQYLELLTKVALALRGDDVPFNGIVYADTPQGTISKLRPNTNTNYTHKQLQSTMGVLLPWYVELANSYYPINSDSDLNSNGLRRTVPADPILFGDDPYPFMENVFTTNAGGNATRKARIAFQLPVGQYRFKMFYSKNSVTLAEARRVAAWYRIDASGVIGTPVNQWDAGFDTQHTHQWAES